MAGDGEKMDVEEKPAEKTEAKPEEEKPKEEKPAEVEVEGDAPADKRKKVAETVAFSNLDATLNVYPWDGTFLKSLSHGGFQYLLAGARATVGVKSGRYMFEARVIEQLNPVDPPGGQSRPPQQKNIVRLGLTTDKGPLLQDISTDCVYFESDGMGYFGEQKQKVTTTKFDNAPVAVLLNLDAASPNANTVSLFINGSRACQPKALPASFKGKTLYPTVTFKNVTLQVNFGPAPIASLPFACRMLQDAAAEDVDVLALKPPKDGKYEVVVPVGLPDTGLYDWATDFLAKNPGYTELSERQILSWAAKSGLWVPKGTARPWSNSDKAETNFGLPLMDDGSVKKLMDIMAPAVKRNFLVLNAKSSMLSDDRKSVVAQFNQPHFKKVAKVMLGEPDAAFKKVVQDFILEDKRVKAEAEKKKKEKEEERKKLIEERKKAALAAKKLKEGGTPEEEPAAAPAEDVTMEDSSAVTVELTEEEKGLWCRKSAHPEINPNALNKVFSSFTLPSKEEGFDTVQYTWQPEKSCQDKLKEWITTRKRTTRVDDIVPGATFKEKLAEWQKVVKEWRAVHREWADPTKRKALLQKKKDALKAKQEDDAKEAGADPPAEAPEIPVVDADEIDIQALADVKDIGSGEPLFARFEYEDWMLLEMRYMLHLLVLSFPQDLQDPERPCFHESHLTFYYTKYYKKPIDLKSMHFQKHSQLVEVLSDTIIIKEDGMVATKLEADASFDLMMKLAEEHRRERQRRVDAGDETALLKFARAAIQPAGAPPSAPGPQKWGASGPKVPGQTPSGPRPTGPSARPVGQPSQGIKRPAPPTLPPAKRSFISGGLR